MEQSFVLVDDGHKPVRTGFWSCWRWGDGRYCSYQVSSLKLGLHFPLTSLPLVLRLRLAVAAAEVLVLHRRSCFRSWQGSFSDLPTTTAFPPLSSIFPKGSYCYVFSPVTWNDFSSFFRTYLVSSPIIAYYYTQLIGDAKNLPTLLAAANFTGIAVIGTYHTN